MELPPVGYYFMVNFFQDANHSAGAGIAALQGLASASSRTVDMRFQKVSGFRVNMSPFTVEEGGQNLFTHRLPNRFQYENLVLERGMTHNSKLNAQFQETITSFRFTRNHVLVTLLDENDDPVTGWLFYNAYPVSWATSELNADENKIVIETLELAYTRFQRMQSR